jgi:CDP-glycerol glycerophosphotransferase (TagB/SpsB family)
MMPNRYVFFVSAAYCYGIYRPIQELIWQRGEEAAWFFVDGVTPALTEKEHLLENERAVKAYAPNVVFGAADWIPYYFPGIKVMLFHGMAINKRADANDVHYKIRGWYDLYCTHAEQDTKIFESLAKQHQNFYVRKTGWPKLDSLIKQKAASNSAGASGKTLFFASTFSPEITCAPIVADELKRISLEEGWNIIATLHPLMDRNTVDKFRSLEAENFTFLPPEVDLYPAMLQADVMLCDTSSIMYEFMFLNKPVVTVNTRNPGPFLTNVSHVEDVFPAIQTLQNNAQQQLLAAQIECKRLNEFNDGNSSARVLDAIDEVLSGKFPPLKPKPLNLIRKLKLRKRLNYWKF